MPTTLNLLPNADSLVRFTPDGTIEQSAAYLNNQGSPRHGWSISGGILTVASTVVKLPSCNSLLVTPGSTGPVRLSLSNISIPGTVRKLRSPVRYIFHCLLLSANELQSSISLTWSDQSVSPRTYVTNRDQFSVVRSNILEFDPENSLPAATYLGSDPRVSISIDITQHEGQAFYLTFPALIDYDAWKYNSVVPASTRYMPTMYRDIDETQDPEFPFFRLIDVLSWNMGDASQLYADWFRYEPDELPSNAVASEQWTRSQLTDAMLANKESLRWGANIVGRHLLEETYAIDPTTSELTAFQQYSYPLEMTIRLEADVATVDNISIQSGLRVVAKWSSVRTSTTTNIDLSTALVNGATFNGVVVATGDRVLVRHQSTTSQNGIYIVAASGAASRASDADASGEFSDGKAVKINEGAQGGTYAKVSIPSSFTLGTSPIAFSTELFPGVVDGIDLADGDNVLLLNQDDPAENGLYTISSSSTAVRHASLNEESEFEAGVYIEVLTGSRFANTLWRLFVEEAVELGVSPIQIFYYDRRLDFFRTQVSTGMYGLNAGTYGSIQNAAKRFLIGDRQLVIDPNVPSDYTITVRTLLDETIGVDTVDLWTECAAATTADVDISVGLIGGSVVDGVILAAGDRILVKDQVTLSQNGIYVAQSSGAAVRASDADNSSEFAANKSVYVADGVVNGESYYTVTTLPVTVGTDSIEFERASNLGSSDVILKALEPTRPLGFIFNHETINKFAFTLDSSALGRIGTASLA